MLAFFRRFVVFDELIAPSIITLLYWGALILLVVSFYPVLFAESIAAGFIHLLFHVILLALLIGWPILKKQVAPELKEWQGWALAIGGWAVIYGVVALIMALSMDLGRLVFPMVQVPGVPRVFGDAGEFLTMLLALPVAVLVLRIMFELLIAIFGIFDRLDDIRDALVADRKSGGDEA